MKINIKLMTEKAYKQLSEKYEKAFDHMKNNDNIDWLENFCNEKIWETKVYLIEDFELDYSSNYEDVELKNAITLYEHLHHLPRYIICNKRFWAWIIFEKAYKQSKCAMEFKASVLKSSWFNNDSRRGLMLNVMGRQYFKVELSIDETFGDDKYTLTKYIFTNHNLYKNLVYRNIGMLKHVSLAVLKSEFLLNEGKNFKYSDNLASAFVKSVSRLGSAKLIDIISEEEIMDYLLEKMESKVDEEFELKSSK